MNRNRKRRADTGPVIPPNTCPACSGLGTGHRYGYARVSTDDQDVKAQRMTLEAAGCCKIFTDEGVSGKLASRPGWDVLRGLLAEHDMLVTTKVDRLGRKVKIIYSITEHLEKIGANLTVLSLGSGAIDTSDPFGKMLFTIIAVFAEFEGDIIVDRITDTLDAARDSGNMRKSRGGRPPLGFRWDGKSPDWELDEKTGDYLRRAAARVLAGEAVAAVHADLGPIANPTTGKTVTAKMLRTALLSPASAGMITDGDGEFVRDANIGGPLDKATYVLLKAEVFQPRTRGGPVDAEGRYPLGPVLVCGKCGNQLNGELHRQRKRGGGYTGVTFDMYSCNNPHPATGHDRPCRGTFIRAAEVHELVKAALAEWGTTPAARRAAEQTPAPDAREAELVARILKHQGWLSELYADRELMGEDEFAEQAERYRGLLQTERAELKALKRTQQQADEPLDLSDWDKLPTAAAKVTAVRTALVSPLVVQPGKGYPKIDPAERVEITLRTRR